MPEYLVKYRTESYMFDGCWMPDPDAHINEHRFTARNNSEAREKAIKYIPSIEKLYFSPKTKLESLLKIDDVNLK